MTADAVRSARLLLESPSPADSAVRALTDGRVPPLPVRVAQRVAMKAGRLTYERNVVEPLVRLRSEALGAAASGPPRFLVRVDEYPHYLAWDEPERYGTEPYRRFHEIMACAGVPYLIAVPPRVSRAPLDPSGREWRPIDDGEASMLAWMRDSSDGLVGFGLHGRDHRTRHESPRRHSELCGLSLPATEELLDTALGELRGFGIETDVFVPPYNRFDAAQYEPLAARFRVIGGGPESVPLIGFHRPPVWRGGAVYLPSYFPLYGRAADVLPAASSLIERQVALWTPIVLHWGWEADRDWTELEQMAKAIAPYTARWDEFLDAVRVSAGDAER
ncbi:MAG: DUF2334 domain-containing protein [Thermoleophilaceae bacterium]